MKISFVGHAALVIEAGGLRVLSDPWWEGACFGSQWWVYPQCDLSAVRDIDYIYISHGHADHLHPGTLRRLPKTAKCLVATEAGISDAIRDLGFDVVELKRGERRDLGSGVMVEILPTYGDDTLMVLTDGHETCVNANDALHAAPEAVQQEAIAYLKGRYPVIDYAFCGYGMASHFPNCYAIPGKDRVQSATARQHHFNVVWSRVISALAPKFAFPFAANVVFLDDALSWSNEPVHNSERPTDVFRARYPQAATQVFDIAPGFAMEDGRVTVPALFAPVRNADVMAVYKDSIASANKVSPPDAEAVAELAKQLERNVALCRPYLQEFPGDYRFLIVLNGAARGIEIEKRGADLQVRLAANTPANHDIVFRTRYAYLRRALSHPYGHETLFVGSGCIIEYASQARVAENLHRELTVLLRQVGHPPASRFGDQSRTVYAIKTAIKRLLGKQERDIYSLQDWTRYKPV